MGKRFLIVSFGESHGEAVGVVIDGCPAGLRISSQEVEDELKLRRPVDKRISTPRVEEDKVEILSGVFKGYTTGAPIAMIVRNREVDSKPYEEIRDLPRPGHADYTAKVKYGGYNDYRGGGRFSGRITASFVMAGAVAKKLISKTLGTEILAFTSQVGPVKLGEIQVERVRKLRYSNPVRCPDPETADKMVKVIEKAKREGDSVGGIIKCIVLNPPIGLGDPVFDSLESDLSKALFSIPAVKAVEFGSGFKVAEMRGSENNDQFIVEDGKVKTLTNNSGGILGGISNGMPITFAVAVKPTPSIPKPQKTVNLKTLRQEKLVFKGRHDTCIVPRAVPVVEALTAVVLADHSMRSGLIKTVLGGKSERR